MSHLNLPAIRAKRIPWNKGRIIGQKRPLLPKHVWAIRVRLELAGKLHDLALFNMAIDSKLRGWASIKPPHQANMYLEIAHRPYTVSDLLPDPHENSDHRSSFRRHRRLSIQPTTRFAAKVGEGAAGSG
ncbi:hypothetical protein PH5382_03832 [Phaeobacter sp. CECT 5382]|nr:hypothetical protein PH5382_03832 [Phaeobacter sp. CECT 5382]